ncbi:hypothetical protein [Desulfosarcina ovata]|nr:hypothetical protein [Desulfosarcina ovata]
MDDKPGFEFLDSILFHDLQAAGYTTGRFKDISNRGMGGLQMMVSEQKKHLQNMIFEDIFMSRIYVQGTISKQQKSHLSASNCVSGRKQGNKMYVKSGVPKGIRTPVAGVKGRKAKFSKSRKTQHIFIIPKCYPILRLYLITPKSTLKYLSEEGAYFLCTS